MLVLYIRDHCPYCDRVLGAGKEMGLLFALKNIGVGALQNELVLRGGKRQVPYLVDDERRVEMYESVDIVIYLRDTYGKKTGLQ